MMQSPELSVMAMFGRSNGSPSTMQCNNEKKQKKNKTKKNEKKKNLKKKVRWLTYLPSWHWCQSVCWFARFDAHSSVEGRERKVRRRVGRTCREVRILKWWWWCEGMMCKGGGSEDGTCKVCSALWGNSNCDVTSWLVGKQDFDCAPFDFLFLLVQ